MREMIVVAGTPPAGWPTASRCLDLMREMIVVAGMEETSQEILQRVPRNCSFGVRYSESKASSRPTSSVTVARFRLDAPVLPLATDTLPLAEAVRSTLLARVRSATLSGKDAAGQPLLGHRHAYFLPADEDGDGRLDHVTLLAEDGFTPDEVRAIQRLHCVQRRDGEVRLLLIGLGRAADFRSPLLTTAPNWVSATPFTATRYPKRRGQKRDAPADCATPQHFASRNLVEELERLRARRPDLPAFEVEPLPGSGAQQRFRPLQYQRDRRKQNDDGGRRPAGGFRIRFAVPTPGPLCLGHSAHFGLGLFVPEVL